MPNPKVLERVSAFNIDTSKMSELQATNDGFKVPYDCITIEAMGQHTATVIWLHGLGDSAKGMHPYANDVGQELGLEHVRIILPTAHRMVVQGANKAVMNSWFNCFSFDYPNRKEDIPGLQRAAALLNDIIARETRTRKIPSNRIVIGGISQGSATSLYTALTSRKDSEGLAGVFVMAGYVPLRKDIKDLITPHARTLPIYWGHGRIDPRLTLTFSLETAATLASDLGIPFVSLTGADSDLVAQRSGRSKALRNRAKHGHLHSVNSDDKVSPTREGAKEKPRPELKFVEYDDCGHWMNEIMIEDLAAWLKVILPQAQPDTPTITASGSATTSGNVAAPESA